MLAAFCCALSTDGGLAAAVAASAETVAAVPLE